MADLVNCQCEDIEISIFIDMKPSKRLVIGYSEGGEGFVKMQVKPVNAYV